MTILVGPPHALFVSLFDQISLVESCFVVWPLLHLLTVVVVFLVVVVVVVVVVVGYQMANLAPVKGQECFQVLLVQVVVVLVVSRWLLAVFLLVVSVVRVHCQMKRKMKNQKIRRMKNPSLVVVFVLHQVLQ